MIVKIGDQTTVFVVTHTGTGPNEGKVQGYEATVELGPRGWVNELSPHDDLSHQWSDIFFLDADFAAQLRPWPNEPLRVGPPPL